MGVTAVCDIKMLGLIGTDTVSLCYVSYMVGRKTWSACFIHWLCLVVLFLCNCVKH